jgi:hypothetical protein
MLSDLKNKAANAARDTASSVSDKAKEVTGQAKDRAAEQVAVVKSGASSARDKAKNEIVDMVLKGVEKGLDKATVKVAALAGSDPDMPWPVKKGVEAAVKTVMKEVQADIVASLYGKLGGKDKNVLTAISEDADACCSPNPCSWFRSWVLYTMFPHDLTVWGKMRVKSWWFIMLMANFPVYGVSQLYFFLLFVLMDKGDIFQLVNFVVSLKVAAVVAVGVIPTILGGVLVYLECVPKNTCATQGPGMQNSLEFLLSSGFFGLQMVLTWVAALCLCCAKTKGNRENVDEHTTARVNTGLRRFAYFVVYDITVAGAMFAFVAMNLGGTYFVSIVFWAKCFYGYLCLPWIILKLPLMDRLLVSTKRTAYNPRGKTVPKATSSERAANRKRRRTGKKVSPV